MSRFTEAVERELLGLTNVSPGIAAQCPVCRKDYGEPDAAEFARKIESQAVLDEGSFSKRPCNSCGNREHGIRYDAHGFDLFGNLIHLSICEDCLQFHANGVEPAGC